MPASSKAAQGRAHSQASVDKTRSGIHSETPTDIPMGMGAGPAPPGQRFVVKTQHFGNLGSTPGSEPSRTPAASPFPAEDGGSRRHPPAASPAGRGSRGGRRGAPGAAGGSRASPGKWPTPAAAGARPQRGSWQRRTWEGTERGDRAVGTAGTGTSKPSPGPPSRPRAQVASGPVFPLFFAATGNCGHLIKVEILHLGLSDVGGQQLAATEPIHHPRDFEPPPDTGEDRAAARKIIWGITKSQIIQQARLYN